MLAQGSLHVATAVISHSPTWPFPKEVWLQSMFWFFRLDTTLPPLIPLLWVYSETYLPQVQWDVCWMIIKQCEMYYSSFWILHHVNENQFSSLINICSICCRGKGEEVANTKIYSLTYITFSAFVHSTFRECIPIPTSWLHDDLADISVFSKRGIVSEYTKFNLKSVTKDSRAQTPPPKAERGSGVLSNISCHMGWGLQRKECHIYILHPGLSFLTT